MADPASAEQILDAAVDAGLSATIGDNDTPALDSATHVVTTVHKPGDAFVTAADQAALEAKQAEPVVVLDIYEAPLVLPTATPEANLAARSNIVSDGPGTVGS